VRLFPAIRNLRQQFKYKPDFLSRVKQNHSTGNEAGGTYNRYNVSLHVYLLFVISDQDE